ncbi:7980_t:CDS:2 [Gigaspora rosea]|nr:7980_t:CDS:2 [Gigaspora rosea]
MKLSRYPYKLISQCTFLISLFILITPLKSQTTSSEITHISYSESTTGTSFPQSAPQVVNVQTYDDGIILVSVARQSYSQIQNVQTQTTQTYNSSQCTQIFENILRLRVIQLDGSIKEINPSLNLDPMNYCDYKSQIIPFIVVGIGNLVLYIYSQYGTTEYDKLKLMINVVTGGLFTASHTSFSSIFAFSNIGNHPELSVTSQVVLIFSISLNFAMFIWIMCKGGMKTIQTTNLITVLLSLYNAETLLAINEVKILEIFEEKYEHIVQYRSCADILIKNIPLLIIQVKFYC